MNIGRPYIDLGAVDIDAIAHYVNSLTLADWQKDMSRQARYKEHQQTQTVFIRFMGRDFPRAAEFLPILDPILAHLPGLHDLQSCFLVKLPAGREVSPHDDIGEYFARIHRYHIPIVTNDQVRFQLGNLHLHLETGRLYEINNCSGLHSVRNEGDADRVHLIFDLR